MRRANWIGLVASVGILVTRSAWTQEPPPPPTFGYYSLPIGMRPVLAVTGLRLDSSIGLSHDRMNNPVSTEVSILSARYRISDGLTVGAAAAFIYDHPEAPQLQTAAWSNVQLGAAYSIASASIGFSRRPWPSAFRSARAVATCPIGAPSWRSSRPF